MPNPKAGTITFDLDRAVREVKGGRVEFKVDKAGIIHAAFGRASFEPEALVANLAALIDAINRARPAGAKGQYLRGLTIATTMGPGIRVDLPAVLAAAARSGRRVTTTEERRTRQRQPAPAGRDAPRSATAGA
jgi:large subunit ribosomal protein L1